MEIVTAAGDLLSGLRWDRGNMEKHRDEGMSGNEAVSCSCLFYSFLLRWFIHPVVLFLQHVNERPADALNQLLHLSYKWMHDTEAIRELNVRCDFRRLNTQNTKKSFQFSAQCHCHINTHTHIYTNTKT